MFTTYELIGPFLESMGLLGGMVDNHLYLSFSEFSLIFYSDHMWMEVFGRNPRENYSVSSKTVFSR
jgi:hypothetical protein